MTVKPAQTTHADVMGIGFGPANLSLAIAMTEILEESGVDAPFHVRFFERQEEFGWHVGMLLEAATMQVSFLKDLVTLRNPTSTYSFLSYLKAQDRLADFINRKSFFPLRVEFHDYLRWTAAQFADLVDYGSDVCRLTPLYAPDGTVDQIEAVGQRAGKPFAQRAKNVVVGTGLEPSIPPGVRLGGRIWHSSDLLHHLKSQDIGKRRFVVVGAGQSAAEVVAYLHGQYAEAEVYNIMERYGYSVADDTSFANRVFDLQAVNHFFDAPANVKDDLLRYHAGTNYSVVDADLIQELYRRLYIEKVTGNSRLRIMNASKVVRVQTTQSAVEVEVAFLPTGEETRVTADVIIYATGYRPRDPRILLDELEKHCVLDDGGLQVTRNYRVVTDSALKCAIYLQGPTESSHGVASGLLSSVAMRAGEIAEELLRNTVHPTQNSDRKGGNL